MPVFIPSVLLILLLVVGTVSNPERAGNVFSGTLAYVTRNFGWFYMLSVAVFLVFIVVVATSKWGSIKLGPAHSEPQYSFVSWFAMLFSAGYGIEIGRAHVWTPVTNAHLLCGLLLAKKQTHKTPMYHNTQIQTH